MKKFLLFTTGVVVGILVEKKMKKLKSKYDVEIKFTKKAEKD